ncbi:hypothetical protein [Natronorubrum sp. DTA7]|uniref:hypothetical protein n=1 Tax=Natronorubrum sp. DTA7 TaxID=3447016 RepID=UPI003F87BCBB
MNSKKAVVRHGLVGGGFVTLLLAGTIVVGLGVPTTPSMLGVVSWLVFVGATMLVAGRRERVRIGSRTVDWPRVAAVAIAMIAVGWGVISFGRLLAGDSITGIGPIEAVLTVGMVGYFAWFARECWVGGARIDPETFAVD